jgi:hypothetical protein
MTFSALNLCLLTVCGPARADFSEDAVAVIRQVIEDDIARQVVPNGAKRFPALCDLLPASVHALKDGRFDGFPAIAREEVAATAGLVAFIVVDRGKPNQQLGQPSLAANPAALQTFPLRRQTIKLLGELAGDPGWAAQLPPAPAETCEFEGTSPGLAPRQSVPASVLALCAGPQAQPNEELSCAVGIAVRDAAAGDTSQLAADGRRAAVAIAAAAAMQLVPELSFAEAISDVNQLLTNAPSPIVPLSGPSLTAPVEQKLRALLAQAAGLTAGGALSLERTLELVAAFGTSASVTAGGGIRSAPQIAALRELLRGSRRVYQDIQAKNYAAAAGDVFDTLDVVVTEECGSNQEGACSEHHRLVRAFLRATTIYTIDALTTGYSDDVSANFRAAAVDLIEDSGGAGIRRKTFSTKSGQYPGWYFPNFSLRGALRPGFARRTDPGTNSSNFSTYASVDWPNLRYKIYPGKRATNPLWVGGNFSFIDAIGPLYEAAVRNPTLGRQRTRAGQAFGLGFIVPRVEFEFGVPELTRNLVVGAGATVRLYRAVEQPITTATLPTVANYCFALESHCPGGTFNANNFEASLFVKYVP